MYLSFPLAALALAFSVYGHPSLKSQPIEDGGGTDLKPININDFEIATGLRRRATEDFSHLNPSDQTQLIYGRPGSRFSSRRNW